MKHQISSKKKDHFCDKVWLEPIAQKSDTFALENMGLELELHAFDATTFAPLGTSDDSLYPQDLLNKISADTSGAQLIKDNATNTIIGVKLKSGGNFSLEPGGQIEYSSKPTNNLKDVAADVHYGLTLLENAAENKVLFLSHGTNPIASANHPLVVPKERYKFMTRYFESAPKNIRGIHMMRYSATVQPNLDIFGSADWHTGVKLILQLVPITNQLFANSAFFQGKKSNFPSERQNIWDNMDPTRSGYPTNLISTPGCPQTECAYAQWAKKAYMLFIDGLAADKQPLFGEITFEQWLQKGYCGRYPNIKDWETHLGSLFPHLRLRRFLEIRNIDAQPFEHTFAPLAFYSAILKNHANQQKTWNILKQYNLHIPDIIKENPECKAVFHPLLDFACEVLEKTDDKIGIKSLQSFKDFLSVRNNYLNEPDGLSFVKKHATLLPAEAFGKNINS